MYVTKDDEKLSALLEAYQTEVISFVLACEDERTSSVSGRKMRQAAEALFAHIEKQVNRT